MYASLPFLKRFEAAADDGFACVEFWVAPDLGATCHELARLGLKVSTINVDPGPGADSAGLLSDPTARDWWREEFRKTVDFALQVGCPTINTLAGGRADLSGSEQLTTMLENLEWALAATPPEVVLLLEPLNRADRPDYLLHTIADTNSVAASLGDPPALQILFDAYHLYQEEGQIAELYLAHADRVGHVQVADVPGRGEPGSGVIDFVGFWQALAARYEGWLGLEYASGSDGLAWLAQAGLRVSA